MFATCLMSTCADALWGKYVGPFTAALCTALRELHDIEYVLPCCSGTFAVELALRAVGVRADDEVILAGYDFPGNFRAIEAVGAMPVLADIDPHTWCLDVHQIGRQETGSGQPLVGTRTRALIVSHLHGGLAEMQQLGDIARSHGVAIVEDACQAHGARWHGRVAGAWGDVGVLSFGGSKLLSAGRGGAILTNDPHVYQRAKIYVQRGNDAFPLSELQAAVLLPQISKLQQRNAWRRTNVQLLARRLRGHARHWSWSAWMRHGDPPAITRWPSDTRVQRFAKSPVIRSSRHSPPKDWTWDPAFEVLHVAARADVARWDR